MVSDGVVEVLKIPAKIPVVKPAVVLPEKIFPLMDIVPGAPLVFIPYKKPVVADVLELPEILLLLMVRPAGLTVFKMP